MKSIKPKQDKSAKTTKIKKTKHARLTTVEGALAMSTATAMTNNNNQHYRNNMAEQT